MKKLLVTCVLLGSFSAMAFQSPVQQSGSVFRAVLNSIQKDPKLELMSIRKITSDYVSAKAQLLDHESGNCLAIPYTVKANRMGEISVEVNTAAFAVCD